MRHRVGVRLDLLEQADLFQACDDLLARNEAIDAFERSRFGECVDRGLPFESPRCRRR